MDDARARALLGVTSDAPPDAVRAAYRRLLRRHHPDVAGSSADATRRTAELNRAYAIVAGEAGPTTPVGPAPTAPPPPPPPAPAAPRTTFDMADDADGVITVDADAIGPAAADVFNRLCEAADTIGALSYVDRANTILETIISPPSGPTCSLMVTLEQHGDETLAYCTLEALDAREGPPIEDVVSALTRELYPSRELMVAGPLDGITVLDLTRVLAGPYCTMVLSDLGARVVKVERPGRGDDARHIGPFVDGVSAYFASLNRGKESVALDLRADDDRRRFDDLLADADVLVENFRPGVMAGLGYGWDTVHQRHPRLVYASVSGFGQTGPYAERPAYDMVVQGMGGIMSITGSDGGDPTRVGTSVGDITAGLFTAVGISTALYHRERSGEGQHIDVSLLDGQVAILENAIARYVATGVSPGPIGNRHPSITPFATYRAADGWLVVAAGNDDLFERLCTCLGLPELLGDPTFATNASRTEHVDALTRQLERVLVTRPVQAWLDRLAEAEVPCGPVNTVADVLADPQVRARNMVVEVDDPALPGFRVAGNPIKLSGFADPPRRGPVPPLGSLDPT